MERALTNQQITDLRRAYDRWLEHPDVSGKVKRPREITAKYSTRRKVYYKDTERDVVLTKGERLGLFAWTPYLHWLDDVPTLFISVASMTDMDADLWGWCTYYRGEELIAYTKFLNVGYLLGAKPYVFPRIVTMDNARRRIRTPMPLIDTGSLTAKRRIHV